MASTITSRKGDTLLYTCLMYFCDFHFDRSALYATVKITLPVHPWKVVGKIRGCGCE